MEHILNCGAPLSASLSGSMCVRILAVLFLHTGKLWRENHQEPETTPSSYLHIVYTVLSSAESDIRLDLSRLLKGSHFQRLSADFAAVQSFDK